MSEISVCACAHIDCDIITYRERKQRDIEKNKDVKYVVYILHSMDPKSKLMTGKLCVCACVCTYKE